MDKWTFIFAAVSIAVTLFAIAANTDNIWNSPNFEIKIENLEKNEIDKKPVDEIIRVIYDDRNYLPLNATWLRMQDDDYLEDLKVRDRFSSEDLWILDRIYYNSDADGLSQKILITNNGQRQAHDVLVQISGNNNFKIIEYICPEIMSDEQIIKELGKNYIVSISRMSVKLDCAITINSVGDDGIKEVIVTAEESHPRIWPDHLINDLRTFSLITYFILYVIIGTLAIIAVYNIVKILEKRATRIRKTPV